ncbi:MAG: hypothetical protein ACK559_16630, partial [bacterium]
MVADLGAHEAEGGRHRAPRRSARGGGLPGGGAGGGPERARPREGGDVAAHVAPGPLAEAGVGHDVLGRHEAEGEVDPPGAEARHPRLEVEAALVFDPAHAVQQAVLPDGAGEDLQ